jgi:hypothetical protein
LVESAELAAFYNIKHFLHASPRTLNHYEIVELIGEDGMGSVSALATPN